MITLLVKVFGYAEKWVLAYYFGTSNKVDVYILVLSIVLSIFFFFREIIEPGFLNVFMETRSTGKETISWDIFNKAFRLIFFITLIFSVTSVLFPDLLSGIFAPGFKDERSALSNMLIRIAIPACIFLSLSTLTSITLNGLKMFVLPASGELAFKGLIIVCIVIFYKNHGIIGTGIGIVIGSVARLGIHLFVLYNKISFKKITMKNQYKIKIWQLTWPLLLGVSFSQISILVDNIFASYLQEGAIAALSYAKKVVELPVVIFPYAISVVIFPYLTKLAVERNKEKLKTLFTESLKWITIVFLPVSVFFIFYSTSIIEILFQRGAFNEYSTSLTSKPFMIYSIGLVFFAIETILVIFYYANADTKTPVFIGMINVILNIILTWVFIGFMGYTGIALAFVIQKTVKNLLLLYFVKHKIAFSLSKILVFILKLTLALAAFTLLIINCQTFFYHCGHQSEMIKMIALVLIFMFAALVYTGLLYFLNVLKTVKV
jgi:murein biosynthesis integral membrane protein MurJ